MVNTYNKYITDGVQDGSIKCTEVDGVRAYRVRAPLPGEEVVGYVTFSGWLGQHTPTQLANGGDKC